MKTASAQRREARQQAEAQAVAVANQYLGEAAPELVAGRDGAGLSKKDCEVLVKRIQDALEPGHWKAARQHLRKRLKKLGTATGGRVYLPPPATNIRRDKSPLAGDAMVLVGELEALIERFLIDVRTNLNAPGPKRGLEPQAEPDDETSNGAQDSHNENTDDAEREELERKKIEAAERKKANQENKRRLRTLGRITFSAIVNGGLLNQGLYRKIFPELCDELQAHGEFAWVTFPLDDVDPDDEGDPKEPGAKFDAPVRRWFLDPVTLGLVTRWHTAQTPEDRRSDVSRTGVQNALAHYLKYLRTLPGAKEELRTALVKKPTALFRAATARTSLYLPPVLVSFLRSTTSGQSMSERTWWRYQFERIVATPASASGKQAPDDTTGLATAEDQKARYRGDKAEFFGRQEGLLKDLRQCLGEPGNRKKADKNGPAAKRIEAVLEKQKGDMAPLLYAFYSWILWKLKQPSKKQGRIRCSSARRYTSRLGQALIALGAELSIEGLGPADWESFYDEVIESLESAIDRTKAVGNLRDFHRFLMINFNAPPVAIDGELDATARTRSTLISDSDYGRLMTSLGGDTQPGHQTQVLRIIAMLMFRAGLRPNELIGLEYRHIQGAPLDRLKRGTAEPILYLHATSSGALKTPSGVRQIRLSWFLSPKEMREFQAFLSARLSVYRDSNRRSAVILTPSQGVNTRISSKEYFGTLTELLREITGDPTVVAYTLRHGCLSKIFRSLLEPRQRHQNPFSRNGLMPREAIYALSTLAGHLDPDITLQSYVHTQDLVCHLHFRRQLREWPVSVWAALEDRKEASLHQRRSRHNRAADDKSGAASKCGEFDQPLDTAIQLIKQLKLEIPKAKPVSDCHLPSFRFEEPTLLDLDLETIYALLISLQRRHSAEERARQFILPAWQINNLTKTCRQLARYRTESTSGTRNFRNLKKVKDRERMPDLYRRAQPGKMGPALPHHSREELKEANRIYSLLARRARELNMDRDRVSERIIKPIRNVLLAHSGSEAVVRAVSAEQFANAIQAIRSLKIPPARIEIELEALPRSKQLTSEQWIRHLYKIAKARKLRVNERSHSITRRSQAHPDFGIAKIRVLALAGPGVGELQRKPGAPLTDRASSGWRVGSFYAVAAITALIWTKSN